MTETLEPIAVIGIAGRFPGASSLNEFWNNLREGIDSISRLSDAELRAAGVPDALLQDPSFVRAAPLIGDVSQFDADLFRFTPRDAALRDPQQRLFLETAHAALEDASYDPERLGGTVGVFGGAASNRYAEFNIRSSQRLAAQLDQLAVDTANNNDYVAPMVSYKLGLRGPSISIGTACSTSLVAVHLACQSLHGGECDMALAGGVTIEFPYGWGYRWTPGSIFSPDGRCRPFDVAAAGTVFGSGVGMVVLKPLSSALADGDHVRAVIRGTAINNDGSQRASFSAPSIAGQVGVIGEAMGVSGVGPESISYVEAHGTGTQLGDPVEVAALAQAYRTLAGGSLPPRSCAIGSVKGNVGHLGAAAGVIGLIKVVLALEHGELPPSINFTEPNPKLRLEETPFYVSDRLHRWPRATGAPRLAAVSSFGVGGTNAHAILEEAPELEPLPLSLAPRLVVWSGRDQSSEAALRDRLAAHFGSIDEHEFADAAITLQVGRTAHPVRAATVASSAKEAAQLLGEPIGGRVTRSKAKQPPTPITFLFPGQGSQHQRMAAGLYGSEAAFTSAMDACLDAMRRQGLDLQTQCLDAGGSSRLDETALAQPLLFAVEYALARMWTAWGVLPAALLGHSVGELVAATLANVWSLEDGIRLVTMRAHAMQAMPDGAMLAVAATEQQAGEFVGDDVALAVVNGPRQSVLSGPNARLGEIEAELRARGIGCARLRTSHAFHSPAMASAVPIFEQAFQGVSLQAPSMRLYSAASGTSVSKEEATSTTFWAEQIVHPVRFGQALDSVLAEGERLLIEVGPAQALTGLARQHPGVASGPSRVIPTLPRGLGDPGGDLRSALHALGLVWASGHEVVWPAVDQHRPVRRRPVPGYPYQRQRYWYDPPATTASPASDRVARTGASSSTASSGNGTVETLPLSTLGWVEPPIEAPVARRRDGTALVLVPDEASSSMPVVAALERTGFRVVRVRPADAYGVAGHEFRVRPGEAADLERVLGDLAARGMAPALLVHAWTVGRWDPAEPATIDQQLRASFYSALSLVQLGLRQPPPSRPDVLLVTERSADVSGDEVLDPAKAMLHGLVRTVWAEAPEMICKLVDVKSSGDELVHELMTRLDSGIVALRGARRWIPRERPLRPRPDAGAPIRRKGVYVITGGTGGLGMAVAKGMAQTGLEPRLFLLARHPAPEPGDLERPRGDDDRLARLGADLDEVRAHGASVRTIPCDVADPRQLRRALDIVAATAGPINGVVHAAGVAGGGLLRQRRPEDAAEVMRPKVLGAVLLEKLLADRPPLDFFVSFSSRAALEGLLGSGDYAAANAFLDAHAAVTRLANGSARSINWPSWSDVGMAARAVAELGEAEGVLRAGGPPVSLPAPDPEPPSWEGTLSAETHWVLDEHRVGSSPVLPGTAYLDLVLRGLEEPDWGAGRAVRFREVVFERPLVAETARQVRVNLQRDGRGLRFLVVSRPARDTTGPWTEHARGHLAVESACTTSIDLPEIEQRTRPRGSRPAEEEGLVTLGPRWQSLADLRFADGEVLASFALPTAFESDLAAYPLHPALLDAATAVATWNSEAAAHHLPFLYHDVTVFGRLPGRFRSHVRYRASRPGQIVADIDLVTPDGAVVVAIKGFTMRRVDGEAFTTGLRARDSGSATSRPPASSANERSGIPPVEGTRLLLGVLAARTPPQVAVRPYGDGRPVPLDDRFDAVAGTRAGELEPSGGTRSSSPGELSGTATELPRQANDAPGTATRAAAGSGDAASLRTRLQELWVDALGVEDISTDDDFFELGGNSLSAIQLISRIRDSFDVELSIGILFDFPTIEQLAEELRRQGAA